MPDSTHDAGRNNADDAYEEQRHTHEQHQRDKIWKRRSGLWWGDVPHTLKARSDQLTPGDVLRVTVMTREGVLGSLDLTRTPNRLIAFVSVDTV